MLNKKTKKQLHLILDNSFEKLVDWNAEWTNRRCMYVVKKINGNDWTWYYL